MSTGTEHTERRALDNNSLADALVTLAGMLRLNPQLPPVSSVAIALGDYHAGTWEAVIHPCVTAEEQSVDAVRTFAAVFGPDATLHLDTPRRSSASGETHRYLAARGTRDGLGLEAWAFIARTSAKDDA